MPPEGPLDVVGEAPRLLAGLFGDGGATLLAEGGLGGDWVEALGHVPPQVLDVAPGADAGLRQLLALRDFWSARGDLRPALAATRALLNLRVAAVGAEHPDTLVELAALGVLAQRAGRVDEGGKMLEQAYESLRARVTGRDLRLAVVAQNVGGHRLRQGRLDDAEQALTTAWRIRKEVAPASVALVAAQLGEVRLRLGRPAEAIPLLEDAWQRTAAVDGPTAPRTLARAQTLGAAYNQAERFPQAAKVLRPVLESVPPTEGERRATVAFELGLALDRSGVREEGLRLIEEAVRWTRKASEGRDRPHPTLPNRLTMMAEIQLARGRPAEAEGLMLEALEVERRLSGGASAEVAHRTAAIGHLCLRFGRDEEALGWLDAASSLLMSTLGPSSPRTRSVVEAQCGLMATLAEAAASRRDRELAVHLLRRALELATPVLGHGHERVSRLRGVADRHRLW